MLTYLHILLARRLERGASVVEYALIVAGVLAVSVFLWKVFGPTAAAVFQHGNSVATNS